MNNTSNQYCENTMIINNKEYKLEKIWRLRKNDTSVDAKGEVFPYPKQESANSLPEIGEIIHRLHVMNTYLDAKKRYEQYDEPRDCLLCDKKGVSKRRYMYESIIWEDGLIHYMDVHNIKPSIQFKQFVLNNESTKRLITMANKNISRKLPNTNYTNSSNGHSSYDSNKSNKTEKVVLNKVIKNNKEYVVLERNQILILDALMIHGGYTKRYSDADRKISRYSEHAGFLDFEDNTLSKIVVSGRTNKIDDGDNEIYLPMSMEDMYEYEYIFHTHPPTPRPGGRAHDGGILYEFPSIGDIYHFIDHHNDGNVIGSLVVCAEGLYNIRNFNDDSNNIFDDDDMYKHYNKIFDKTQKLAISEYGTKFNTNTFYAKIAQDTKYIDMMNKVLNNFSIQIDFYPRKKDADGNWIIDTVFLVFRKNKPKK